jgi:predicted AlkP superfamily pyrophosphatase or phosphodiesterase
MVIKYPDYSNSLVNLASSILKHYGAEYRHPSLPVFDKLLMNNYKNVVVLLFDGMGTDALEHHLDTESFLRKHLITDISSVFPPTTTAATTSIESGLTPAEHGWIGWCLYFKEIDKLVNIFPNTIKGSDDAAADYHVAGTILPYRKVISRINETGNAKAYSVSPFGTNKVTKLDELFAEVLRLCNQDGRKYIYSYWEEPDVTMHLSGSYDNNVTLLLQDINDRIEKLCTDLEDTLVIVTADHGHINTKYKILTDYPELLNMMERPASIESRAACFFIKDEYMNLFADEFHRVMGDDFLLLSKQEIKKSKIFGYGIIHPRFEDFIGDYIAIALSDKGIVYSEQSRQYASNHAGMTKQEMMVPFIAIYS